LTLRFKYCLYLLTFCLASTISVQAQFSEDDLEKQANELFDSEKYAEAMPLYSQLLSLNPTNPEYNYKYGATALFGDADKKEEAVKFLKFATKKGGVDQKAQYFLGRAYHLNYQFADAISAYESYKENASGRDIEDLALERQIKSARNGLNLMSQIKDVKVLDKKLTAYESFFRVYELGEIGGKILVTPDELLSSEDKKRDHKSLIHFRGTGTTVYFSSYGKNGDTGLDIFKAQVLPGGQFSDPVKLGGFINSDFDEDYPFMHPDGKTFYFSSNGHSSMGGFDIFKSFYDQGMDVFSQPENLDFAVNTPDDELFYIADTAKKVANFASARSSKQGELYVYKVLVQSNPIELTLVKGSFINRVNSSQKLAKIAVLDAATNEKVSEQYTDPNNGDYVVSVPKSGKYKFIVEVQNSDKVHAGMVDIPKSAGVKAYLQEMELVLSAGVEKLLINNRFDETYDGDVLALAKDLLRKQAELDVNFDPDVVPVPEEEPLAEQDFSLAYKDAGFPAGMSNEKVLESARNREADFQKAIEGNRSIKANAVNHYITKTTEADIKLAEAEVIVDQANQSGGAEKAELMFSAAILKTEAKRLLSEAKSAEELAAKMDAANRELKEKLLVVSSHTDSLERAIDSENYDLVTALMKKENAAQKGELERFTLTDVESSVLQSSLDAKERSITLMEQSAALREESDALNAKLITKRRQLEKAKGKEAKQVELEVEQIENELKDLEESIKTSFKRASRSQALADSEALQYDLYDNFRTDSESLTEEEKRGLLNSEIGGSELNSFQERLTEIEIDKQLVSNYTQNNPDAFQQYDPELRKMVASTYISEDVSQTESSELIANENPNAPKSDEEQLASNSENPSENDAEQPDSDSIDQSSTGSKDANQADLAIVSPELAEKTNNTPEEGLEQSVENNSNQADQGEPLNLDPQKEIDAEKIKIQAAQDWLTVIDASIAELEQGVGGESGEDVEEQLAEYRELREQKLNEIDTRKATIVRISEEKESIPGSDLALQNAKADLNKLSNAQVASLESKINQASSDIDFVRDISQVDPDYIPALTEAELSGLSAPEIASERIAINKELLVSLDKLINNESVTELSEERLRELRTIKLLEIKEDEQVAIGALAYQARTVEAREYDQLLAGENEEKESREGDLSSLSPGMQEDLNTGFTRSLVMESYDQKLAALSDSQQDSAAVSKRMELKKTYLQSLQNEINFYSQTIESQGENAPSQLKERYNELLTDRSKVADEIQEEQELIAGFPDVATNEQPEDDSPEPADEKLLVSTNISEEFESDYQSRLEQIKSLELSESEELRRLAQIRFKQAEKADSLVVVYIDELDGSGSPERKDEIQQTIQKLDAIAADKKQEADRLMYESDILATEATEDELNAIEKEEPNLPETKQVELGSNIEYANLTYKSLNANIAYSKLETKVGSLDQKKTELTSMVEQYNSSTDPEEKKELIEVIETRESEIDSLEGALIRDISESNAAEIAYYQKANDQMLKSIESGFSENADLTEYSERASEISEMLSKNETDRSQDNKTEAQYLADELSLISSLSDLNTDMDVFIKSQSKEEDEELALELTSSDKSPYELLMRNPENHKPEQGKKYLAPIHKQIESTLSDESREAAINSSPELSLNADFADTKQETVEKEILIKSTNVDARGYDLLKSDPSKLEYVLLSVKADSLKTLETEKALLSNLRSQSANEKYSEASRLRNMVIHQNSESDKEMVRNRANKLEQEAELDLQVASIAAVGAERIRTKRIEKEEQLARSAKELSGSELNELNALLRKETYTIIPNVDLGKEEVAEVPGEEKSASEIETPNLKSTVSSTESEYSKDELDLYNRAGNWLGVVEIIGEKDDFSDVEESLFIESEKSAYTDKNPIPIDPVMPDGLIFQVQVGAFRNPIPQNLYKEFAPIMGQRLANGITRYRAGLFRVYQEAKETRDLIREKGYGDAFVVIYVDGERLTGAQARQILAQARELENTSTDLAESAQAPKSEESADATVKTANSDKPADYYNDPEAAEAKQVEITQGLFYTVQVGVYSKPVKLDQVFNLTELNSELTSSGYIRYTSGRYANVQSASTRKNLVVEKGVTDAFITAYYNGKRISLNEARKIRAEKGESVLFNENPAGQASESDTDDVIEYIVIMGIMSGDVPQELAALFEENEDWNIQKTTGPGGQEMYISPKFATENEAMEFLNLARSSGVESAIMGKMVNGSIAEVGIEN